MRTLLERVANVPTPVLLTGPCGSGKEVAARHLHARSARASGPFVAIQCGSIPNEMIEVELFGHSAGAFPGAKDAREGLLASAAGGTVFLDEVAELSPGAQNALLRALDLTGGNRSEAARLLGVSRKSIDRKCAAWGF